MDTLRVHPDVPDDTLDAQRSGLERLAYPPHFCYDGWVFVGYGGEDGELVEVRTECLPCRRCRATPP